MDEVTLSLVDLGGADCVASPDLVAGGAAALTVSLTHHPLRVFSGLFVI